MALILALETSTKNCSVALAEGDKILASREESSNQYIHSEKLHLFIQETLSSAGCSAKKLEAVAVGKGPGSYTGLRIGVSAAKGLCYALHIPLIAMDGLNILAQGFAEQNHPGETELILPMLDARRMEVYTAVFDHKAQRQSPIEAKVLEEGCFADLVSETIHLIGDGAEKAKSVLPEERFQLHDMPYPSAKILVRH
ncbi:MAG: tRNA (adenosine(37)-N6)-threonylcarbamoyltransferase complex dimerization subunit type 1 TsaB, partial [Owenweeksia sp.]